MHTLSTAKSKNKYEVSAPQWQAHPIMLSAVCVVSTLLFLCASTVQRLTFCTFTQTKINRFIQVQAHKARSTVAFLSDAGWFKLSYGVQPGCQLIFCVQILSTQILGHSRFKNMSLRFSKHVVGHDNILSFRWNTVKICKVITYCAFLWCSERKKNTCDSRGPLQIDFLTH